MGRITATGPGYDTVTERKVLTALVVNTEVLMRLIPHLSGEAFGSKWCNLIARWCVQFYEEHKEAPGKRIEDVFREWKSKGEEKGDATSDSAEKFLSLLSEEYEQRKEEVTATYAVKTARKHFEQIRVRKVLEEGAEDLLAGDVVKATERIREFQPLAVEDTPLVGIYTDTNAIREAMDHQRKDPLVEYNQGLADFFADSLRAESLISYVAPDKAGKSWFLLDMAFRAVCQRKRVLYFEAGDMGQNSVMCRFLTRAAKRPMYPGAYEYPKEMLLDTVQPRVITEMRQAEGYLEVREAVEAASKLMKNVVKSQKDYILMHSSPAGTMKVETIKSIMKNLESTGWKADLVVIDYADILCPPASRNADAREQTRGIWTQMRALAQEQQCLVVTATQANARSYGAELLTKANFSENKVKNALVSGMIGINVNTKEKEAGLYRLNWIVRRERAFSERKCCNVAGCLAVGNPTVLSIF